MFSRRLLRAGALLLVALAASACANEVAPEPERTAASSATLDISVFTLPNLSAAERAQILAKYPPLDPKGLVDTGLLQDAVVYFDVNKAYIPNQAYVIVVDFSKFSGEDRFFLVDMTTGAVEPHKVAHGQGSDPNATGTPTLFSNTPDSYMSSLGFYLTGEIYDGTHPHSMRIDGLSPDGSPNDMADTNVRSRAIVVHEASYVSDADTGAQGMSNGCFALDPNIELSVVDRVHGGSLMYAETKSLFPPVKVGADGDAGTSNDSGSADSGGGGSASSDAGGSDDGSGSAQGGGATWSDGAQSSAGCTVGAGAAPSSAAGIALAGALLVASMRRRREEAASLG